MNTLTHSRQLILFQDVNDSLANVQSTQSVELHKLTRQLEEQKSINEDSAYNDEEVM